MDFELGGQRFNWREDKEERNFRKHGVRFQEAAEAMLADTSISSYLPHGLGTPI